MRINRRRSQVICHSVFPFIVALVTLQWGIGKAGAEETTELDCGVNSLFIVLRLAGHPVDLDRVKSALPSRHPDGYSMGELAKASLSLGVPMDGVRFGKGDAPLRRPSIAFLIGDRGGHFIVLRPVGTTGTMVQLIDPPNAPQIMDYDRVLATRAWTGRLLLPRGPWVVHNVIPLLTGAAGLILLLPALVLSLRAIRCRQAQRPSSLAERRMD